jgi:hypothetical protein
MAPELFNDENESYDFAVDVYAFAVTVYSILAKADALDDGKAPPRNPQQWLMRVMRGARFIKKAEITEVHWAVIEACWKHDPKQRPQFQELLNEFHRSHKYILPDADQSAVLEYEERVYSHFKSPKVSQEDEGDS